MTQILKKREKSAHKKIVKTHKKAYVSKAEQERTSDLVETNTTTDN